MQWWNNFVDWFYSEEGSRVFATTILPFLAILVSGIVAGAIGRNGMKRLVAHQDREHAAAAITALIGSGRKAVIWGGLPDSEKDHSDLRASEAEIRVRLLPLPGAGLASDWAAHQLSEMKKNSLNFSVQSEQIFIEYRDRLIAWQARPGRARKLFATDVERFDFDDNTVDNDLVERQRVWAQEQVFNQSPAAVATARFTPAAPVVVEPAPITSAPIATGPITTNPTA